MSEKRELPKGWVWAHLESVARIFSGGSAPQNRSVFAPDGVPFFRVSDLSVEGRTRNLTTAKDRISVDFVSKLRLTKARKGSVVFPKSGAAIATNNRGILGVDGYIVSHLMALEANSKTIPLWLYWTLCQIDMMRYSGNESYPAIRQSVIRKIEIPLPPLAEQERIAGLLARQMAAVEKARNAAEEKLAAARLLPPALLRDAFTQNKNLPNRKSTQLGDVILDIKDGGTPPRKNPNNFGGDINWCVVKDIKPEIWSTRETLTPKGLQNCSAKVWPSDSVIISLGATIGNVGIARIPLATKQGLSGIIVDSKKILSKFLYYILLDNAEFIRSIASGTTFKDIRPPKLRTELRFLLPPLAEQKRIADLLDRQTAAATKAVRAAEDELREIRALPAALLRQAFAGAL